MPKSQPLTFNDVLRTSGLDLSRVLVFRHRPYEPELNRAFEWIAADRSDLYNCYQSTHGPRTEAALVKADYVASFLRHRGGTAVFVALHEVKSYRTITTAECITRSLHQELMLLGMVGIKSTDQRSHVLDFELLDINWHPEWKGRLIVEWPPPDRSWYRWADRNQFPIESISIESQFAKQMPDWAQLVLNWHEIAVLPSIWATMLSQWRGIYLIIDESDGMQYVGSAYGAENILQRWSEYARTGHGGNKHLRQRNPTNFRFSILQRLSPDMPDVEVIGAESSWKDRLRSRWPNGLNDN